MTIQGKKIDKYVLTKVLGKGQFGKVWQAQHTQTGEIFAIKVIDKSKINANPILKRLLQTEVSIMHDIDHPNILHLHDFLESSNNYYLVITFCNQGDFEYYLKTKNLTKLPEEKAVYFLKHIMNGFQVLREKKILHRDFKLANLFVNDEILVIGDFGFAKAGQDMAQTKLGTPLTMAYEIITAKDEEFLYNSKADLWSVGIVYYQMLFGKTPFFGLSIPELIKDINRKVDNLTFPLDVSEESKDLLRKLLKKKPAERIGWQDFFNHPLFNKFGQTDDVNNQDPLVVIGNFLKKSKFQNEFQQNQQKVQNHNNGKDFYDPQRLVDIWSDKQMPTKKVEEQNISTNMQNEITREQIFQKVQYRYNHEKNKIFFFIYTLKKIQKAFKRNRYYQMKEPLFLASLLLIKKAQTLNTCNIQLLNNRQNIYNINQQHFDIAVQQHYQKLLDIFQHDDKSMQGYIQLIYKRVQENNIQVPFINLIQQSSPDLLQIDHNLQIQLKILRGYLGSPELQMHELKHEYLLILLSLQYSINSELFFKYIINPQTNTKFDWNSFYTDHEIKTVEALQKELNIYQLNLNISTIYNINGC